MLVADGVPPEAVMVGTLVGDTVPPDAVLETDGDMVCDSVTGLLADEDNDLDRDLLGDPDTDDV